MFCAPFLIPGRIFFGSRLEHSSSLNNNIRFSICSMLFFLRSKSELNVNFFLYVVRKWLKLNFPLLISLQIYVSMYTHILLNYCQVKNKNVIVCKYFHSIELEQNFHLIQSCCVPFVQNRSTIYLFFVVSLLPGLSTDFTRLDSLQPFDFPLELPSDYGRQKRRRC